MNEAERKNHADRIANLIRKPPEEMETIFDLVEAMTAAGAPLLRLVVERRRLQPEPPIPPIRAESQPRAHTFHDPATFAAYLVSTCPEKGGHVVVLADVDHLRISAVLDDRSDDGFEVVRFEPWVHPLFRPWRSILAGGPVEARAFAAFVKVHRREIRSPDAATLMLFNQVRVAEKLQLDRGRGAKATNGLTVETHISGVDQATTDAIDLPDELIIEVPIFTCSKTRKLTIDILADTRGRGEEREVVVEASSPDVEAASVEEFGGLTRLLGEQLKGIEGIVVGAGLLGFSQWRYLGERNSEVLN